MIILKFKYNKKIGRSKGKIVVRHKKSCFNNIYIPVDFNYFNNKKYNNSYFILYNIKINLAFRNTKLILSTCIKGELKGESRYILKPYKKIYGDFIKFSSKTKKTPGDVDQLKNFIIGNKIYNINNNINKSRMCTSAISYATLISKVDYTVTLKLPSTEIKRLNCCFLASYYFSDSAKIINVKKAGYNILLGKRPKVRGSAMNACDHPHGGGEGKAPIGRKTIYSFTGRKCKGIKTVHKNK